MWTLDLDVSTFMVLVFSGGCGGDDIDWFFIMYVVNGILIIGVETNGLKVWFYMFGCELIILVGRDMMMCVVFWWDGDWFVVEGCQGVMIMYEVMSLSLDGRTFVIEIYIMMFEGEIYNWLVYALG